MCVCVVVLLCTHSGSHGSWLSRARRSTPTLYQLILVRSHDACYTIQGTYGLLRMLMHALAAFGWQLCACAYCVVVGMAIEACGVVVAVQGSHEGQRR